MKAKQDGFTIIELMIATTVFSVILVMVTVVMMGISRLYYKGINQSRVQSNVRNISDEISEKLQLGDTFAERLSADKLTGVYCIGSTRYSYELNKQIGTGAAQKRHVLWQENNYSGPCEIDDLSVQSPSEGSDDRELIAPGARLANFQIIPTTTHYVLNLKVVQGEDDLIEDFSPGDGMKTKCKGGKGQEYCAAASITTRVTKRLR